MTAAPRRSTVNLVVVLLGAFLVTVAAACGPSRTASSTDPTGTGPSESGAPGPALTGSITVLAASSLTGTFGELERRFVAAHPGADVSISFDSSGTLEQQVESGAPADVVAFADEATMKTLADKGVLAGAPTVFARNRLVIVTKPGNPAGIRGLSDLASVSTVSLCAETAPCGRYASQILDRAGVSIPTSKITRSPNVKAALTAVTDGDADAAVVYVTDARTAGDRVATVDIPAESNAEASYPIAVLRSSARRPLAEAWSAFVLGPEGRSVLGDAGFALP